MNFIHPSITDILPIFAYVNVPRIMAKLIANILAHIRSTYPSPSWALPKYHAPFIASAVVYQTINSTVQIFCHGMFGISARGIFIGYVNTSKGAYCFIADIAVNESQIEVSSLTPLTLPRLLMGLLAAVPNETIDYIRKRTVKLKPNHVTPSLTTITCPNTNGRISHSYAVSHMKMLEYISARGTITLLNPMPASDFDQMIDMLKSGYWNILRVEDIGAMVKNMKHLGVKF